MAVAKDGREAIHLYESQPFDLVLMDVQMPDMDGLEATDYIRELEQTSGQHIPIIALTARAMKGDRENCLEHGMDGYVAKPIRQRDLYEAIAPFFTSKDSATDGSLAVDWSQILAQVEDDQSMLSELIASFLHETPLLLTQLENGLKNSNAEEVCRAAHSLKSSSQIFGVGAVAELAEQIEQQSRAGELHGIDTMAIELNKQTNWLMAVLRSQPGLNSEDS